MILRIALLLVVLLVLPALYIDRAFVRRPGWRLLLWSPNALLALATLWFVLFEGFGDNEVVLKGLYLVVLLAVTVPETLFALLSLAGRLSRSRGVRRAFNAAGLAAGGATCVLIVYGYAVGPYQLTVRQATYASADVPPAFDGYRIVQLSDLHLGTFTTRPSTVGEIVDSVNALHPDLIAFTGDLVNYHAERDKLAPFQSELARLSAPDGRRLHPRQPRLHELLRLARRGRPAGQRPPARPAPARHGVAPAAQRGPRRPPRHRQHRRPRRRKTTAPRPSPNAATSPAPNATWSAPALSCC